MELKNALRVSTVEKWYSQVTFREPLGFDRHLMTERLSCSLLTRRPFPANANSRASLLQESLGASRGPEPGGPDPSAGGGMESLSLSM